MSDKDKFAVLRRSRRIWAVSSIHGESERLILLHEELVQHFQVGDRLVYLGNYLGRGRGILGALDALLDFRRQAIALPGMFASDVIHLRGSQEEMWQKLLQLQFAPNPREVLAWMLDQGVGPTIEAYGSDVQQARAVAGQGPMAITRWTGALRAGMQRQPGHFALMSHLRRAAYSDDTAMLFVHAGIDPDRPLTAQSDSLWWNMGGFQRLDRPFDGFRRVVRGFDPNHGGIVEGPHAWSLDAGCGFGGPLMAACFDLSGEVIDAIEA
jgi:serine/threonine protein phosphatase 1